MKNQVQHLRGGAKKGSIFWPVTTCVMYLVSTTVTSPAMPSMANRIANKDGSSAVSPEGVELYGTLTTIDLVFTSMFTKVWGSLSDKYGRKPFMLLSSAGVALGWLTVVRSTATHNMPLLYAGRILDGITSCMQPLCQSAVKDISSPEDLEGNFGILQGTAWGGSFIIGGIAGGILTRTRGPDYVMYFAAAVAAINVVATGLFAPETLEETHHSKQINWAEANPVGAVTVLVRDRVTLLATGSLLLVWTCLNGLQTNFFSYIELRYKWGRMESAILLAWIGVVLSASQSLCPKYVSPRLGTGTTVKLFMVLLIISSVVMALTTSALVFTVAVLFFALGCACVPMLTSIIASRAGEHDAGSLLSALETASMIQKVMACKGMAGLMALGMRQQTPGLFLLLCSLCASLALLLFRVVEPDLPAVLQPCKLVD